MPEVCADAMNVRSSRHISFVYKTYYLYKCLNKKVPMMIVINRHTKSG